MLPVIALVGRPNVGKSTLFNRLTRSRDALVADYPGLTRDRKYATADIRGRRCMVVDTGGVSHDEVGIDAEMAKQSMAAMDEADLVLFIVDARTGLSSADEQFADLLRRSNKPYVLVVNKIDGLNYETVSNEFYALGLGEPWPIAASHGRNVNALLDEAVLPELPSEVLMDEAEEMGIRIAVVGRPNVGKSTMVNRILGEERVVVYDQPGTTRDSIEIPFERHGTPYTLIDTAGVRRRGKVDETVEKFSIVKTLQAIEQSNVVVLVIDAQEGLVEQDLHLIGTVLEAGRALVIAINKWDGLDTDHKNQIKFNLQRRMVFVPWARQHFVSALHGTGVGDLFGSVEEAFESATKRWPTKRLTELVLDAQVSHPPPLAQGRRVKVRMVHQGGANPPRFIMHGNFGTTVPATWKRYLENTLRKVLKIKGTPIALEFKTKANPFEGKKNELTQRQVQRKRRMMKFVKKKK